jgi:predicted dehydrogenase
MKAVFIGLGSVGQRHLQNLKEIAPDIEICALRQGKSKRVLQDGKAFEVADDLEDYYGIKRCNNWSELIQERVDMAFICNPSIYHGELAVKLAELGCHLFIEKPMAINYSESLALIEIVKAKKLITQIGFQTRFNPMIEELYKLINSDNLGQVLSASFVWQTYLPNHHPWEDYSKGYAARKDLGGGVVNCLSHEFDLMLHLFGMPNSVYTLEGGSANLKMNVEETVNCLFQFKEANFSTLMSLSFAKKNEHRMMDFIFSKGSINCDLANNSLEISYNDELTVVKKMGIERNDLFKKELIDFLSAVKNNHDTKINVTEGIKSVKVIDAVHRSLKSKSIEYI